MSADCILTPILLADTANRRELTRRAALVPAEQALAAGLAP